MVGTIVCPHISHHIQQIKHIRVKALTGFHVAQLFQGIELTIACGDYDYINNAE